MKLKLEDKKAIVVKVTDVASSATGAVVVDYRGLKVSEMTDLRAKARQSGVYLQVVRNTLARRALQGTDFACLHPVLKGQVVLAFSLDDVSAAARILQEYSAKYEALVVRGIAIGGQFLGPEKLAKIARLPNRDQALSILLFTIQLPFVHLVRALSAPLLQSVNIFVALGQKQQ